MLLKHLKVFSLFSQRLTSNTDDHPFYVIVAVINLRLSGSLCVPPFPFHVVVLSSVFPYRTIQYFSSDFPYTSVHTRFDVLKLSISDLSLVLNTDIFDSPQIYSLVDIFIANSLLQRETCEHRLPSVNSSSLRRYSNVRVVYT